MQRTTLRAINHRQSLAVSYCGGFNGNNPNRKSPMSTANTMTIVQFTAPTSWTSALIDGDTSGMTERDRASLDSCIQDLVAKYGNACALYEVDLGFCDGIWQTYGAMLFGDYSRFAIIVDADHLT